MTSLNEYSDTLNRVVVYNSRLTTHSKNVKIRFNLY